MNNFDKNNLEAQKSINEELEVKKRRARNLINISLNRYFGIVIAVVVVLIMSASYLYVLKPEYDGIIKNVNTTFFEKNQLLPKYRESDSYKNIAKGYNIIDKTDVARVNAMIPDEYIKEDLFTEIIFIVAHNGFKVNSLDVTKYSNKSATPAIPGGSARVANDAKTAALASAMPATSTATTLVVNLPNGVGAMNVKLSVSDITYKDFSKLLNTLEESLRLLDISDVTYNPGSKSAVFNFSTYYLKK
ncbi:MAG: hypothetical protein WCK37_02665 [Candidatus Falkowbacteria bacterium]